MNNMSQIMKQAKAMQDKMAEMQKKIEEQEVEGSSGGGVIKVLVNGKNEIKSLKIDPTLINAEGTEALEEKARTEMGMIKEGEELYLIAK